MSKTYILGHQKPDTDSVASVMALEYLLQQKSCFGYQNPVAALVDPVNNETQYVLDKFNLQAPPVISADDIEAEDKVILVDHNEASQRLPDLNQAQIVEIIDHHKPNLNLSQALYLNFKPWGSTVSIIYFMMQHFAAEPVQPNKSLASLMLAAILSDTVGFKSGTTTSRDQTFAQELAAVAGIQDLDELILNIFKAKSNLSQLSPVELITNDYKIYNFKQKVLIGQLETVEQAKIISSQKQDLLQAMDQVKQEKKIDLIYLAVTDILKVNTKLLILDQTEQQVAEQAFDGQTQDHVLDIGSKLSRKKEIAPAIEQTLKVI